MSVLRVTCGNCRRGWYVAGSVSVYFQMDLVSHPCPRCEAYALSCADVSRRRRAEPGPHLVPVAAQEDRRPSPPAAMDESGRTGDGEWQAESGSRD
ncbi:MAG TPA: hypothetical protein VKA46_33565 [Gemmataceae bacterium]|nr:hypothetical protein [Gemmataceae bacterium]